MFISAIAQIPLWLWKTALADKVRKPEPSGGEGGFDPLLASEIERLAALSPHLLDDIGVAASDCGDVVAAFTNEARHTRMAPRTDASV